MSRSRGRRQKKNGSKVAIIILIILIVVVGFTGLKLWLGDSGGFGDRVNVLIVGTDENDVNRDSGRADAIIVASIDFKNEDLSLLSLPRDSYVEIPGHGSDKINHSFSYGKIELTRKTAENLLDVPIKYYVQTDFSGFEEIVDILGGVEIDVDKRMYKKTYYGTIDLQPGLQTLNGEEALQYVRFRNDPMGDVKRVERQRIFISAVLDETFATENITKLPKVLSSLSKVLDTNLSSSQLIKLGNMVKDIPAANIKSETAPGNFGSKNGVSYWIINESELKTMVDDLFFSSSTDDHE
ncbi:MAG: LCP family protein [Bacillota bacterium]|jgi:LCP family protein required for cell wall assembly